MSPQSYISSSFRDIGTCDPITFESISECSMRFSLAKLINKATTKRTCLTISCTGCIQYPWKQENKYAKHKGRLAYKCVFMII